MTTMHTQASHLELPIPLTPVRPQCQTAYEPLPNSPSYGVELVFAGKIYQLFSNYTNAPANTVLLHGKRHLCHEPLSVFFQEFRKYVLGPRFGLFTDKHQMILGLEGLDDPLISEIEAKDDECTLWEFWEQACDPMLRFELHTPFDGTLKDNEAISENDAPFILDALQQQQQEEESAMHMLNIDPKDIVINSPVSSSLSLTPSSPSSPCDPSMAASPSENSAKRANSSLYLDQHTVLDVHRKTVMDLNKKLVIDLEKRTIMDLAKGTILDLDKKTILYVNKKSVLDLDNRAIRNMTQRIGLGTTARNSVITTQWVNIGPAVRTGQNNGNDLNRGEISGDKLDGYEGFASNSDDEDLTSDTSLDKRDKYEDLAPYSGDENNYDDLPPYSGDEDKYDYLSPYSGDEDNYDYLSPYSGNEDNYDDLPLYSGDEDNYDDFSPYSGDKDLTNDTSSDYQDSEDLLTDASLGSWAKRKDGEGYDADISDQSSECDGLHSSKKMRMYL